MGKDQIALYDNGLNSIGARPTEEDISLGEQDPRDDPTSCTRQ